MKKEYDMDRKVFDKLMEKYFEGQTSLDEEQLIKDCFRRGKVPAEWESYRPIFSFFDEERECSQERFLIGRGRKNRRRIRTTLLAIAACVLALVVLDRSGVWHGGRQSGEIHSLAYVDGRKCTDVGIISAETLNSLASIEDTASDVCALQIDALELFTDIK